MTPKKILFINRHRDKADSININSLLIKKSALFYFVNFTKTYTKQFYKMIMTTQNKNCAQLNCQQL